MKTKTFAFLIISQLSCSDSEPTIETKFDKELTKELKSDTTQIDASNQNTTIKEKQENYWFDQDFEGIEFIDAGISQPEFFIENSLRNQPELIPLDAVLGGTMMFGNIDLLSKKWIIAEFDDGHVYGRAIYKYRLEKDTIIKFKLLDWIGPTD
jgi:hypothetical protein